MRGRSVRTVWPQCAHFVPLQDNTRQDKTRDHKTAQHKTFSELVEIVENRD